MCFLGHSPQVTAPLPPLSISLGGTGYAHVRLEAASRAQMEPRVSALTTIRLSRQRTKPSSKDICFAGAGQGQHSRGKTPQLVSPAGGNGPCLCLSVSPQGPVGASRAGQGPPGRTSFNWEPRVPWPAPQHRGSSSMPHSLFGS